MKMFKIKPSKKRVSLTLDEEVIEKLKVLSKESYRSLSQYINLVLRRYLNNNNYIDWVHY